MTDPVIRIEPSRLTAEPGAQVRAVVTVTNPGAIVEGFRLDVLGDAPAAWSAVAPAELSIYPQQEARATLTFTIPAQGVPGGVLPFGVRVASVVDPDARAVAEGDLEIGRVFGLSAAVAPVNSAGRRGGRHSVTVTNWGNAPAQIQLTATDPDQKLRFTFDPPTLHVPLGGAAIARLKVSPRRSMMRGSQVRLPFRITADSHPRLPETAGPPPASPHGDPTRPVIDAAFTQKPVLSAGAVTVFSLVLVAGLAGGGFVLKKVLQDPLRAPTIKAEALEPLSIRVTWEQDGKVDNFEVADTNTSETKIGAGDLPGITWRGLEAGQEYCFRVVAVHKEKRSKPSQSDCARTQPAREDPSGPGADGGSGGTSASAEDFGQDWIAMVSTHPTQGDEAAALAKATASANQYRDQNVEPKILLSTDYPRMLPGGGESYIVYLRADTGSEAEAACKRLVPKPGAKCIPMRPEPPG